MGAHPRIRGRYTSSCLLVLIGAILLAGSWLPLPAFLHDQIPLIAGLFLIASGIALRVLAAPIARHTIGPHGLARHAALRMGDRFFALSLELCCRIDPHGRFLQINPAFEQQLGYPPERLVGRHYSELVIEEDRPAIGEAIVRLRTGQRVRALEARILDATGCRHRVEINAELGEEQVIYVVARDITRHKAAECRLRILERGIESCINGVMIANARHPDLPIIFVNPAVERITGYSRDEIIGRNGRFLQGKDTAPLACQTIRAGLAAQRPIHVTLRNYRKDGTPFWNDLYIAPVRDENDDVSHFIGVQNDITTQYNCESQLAFSASHDVLTGLPNRSLLEDRLHQSYRSAKRYARNLAVLYIDLDGFTPINDSLGHQLGDRVLVEVATRLQQLVRCGDTVARFGGDEFVILLPDLTQQNDVMTIVERLLAGIARPYRINDSELRLTASIGIAMSQDKMACPTLLIQQADLAMCKAKRQGHDTYQWYSQDLKREVSERVSLRNALQRAIEEQQFELHYQPQIHGPSGKVIGFEALLRWQHPERGYLSPADFIGLAEDTGQIIPIGQWVLNTACRDNRRLNALGLGTFVMAINVSPVQLQRGRFVTCVMQALEDAELPPSLLELELTENILLEDPDHAIEILHRLRQHGTGIVIDDFGTGFSSLSYLKYLPVDKIKIDHSFMREVISDPRDAAIVRGVISMARQLQLQVIAEGVETRAQFDYLCKHRCDTYQGYYFARPMPLADLATFLREHQAEWRLAITDQSGDDGAQPRGRR